jgi:phage tail-like protein
LLLGRDDWAGCTDEDGVELALHWHASPPEQYGELNTSGLAWDSAHYELMLQPRLFQFASSPFEKALTLDRRRGAGRDRYGNWYWIGDDNLEIRVFSAGSGKSAHFWSAGDSVVCETLQRFGEFGAKDSPAPISPLSLGGLAVTEDHYLVVGVLEPKGLLIFDLHAGGSPRQLLWPAEVLFVPFDIAPRPGGGVWILDRINARYWALDRQFNVIRLSPAAEAHTLDEFQPVDQATTRQSAARPFPEPIELDASSPVAALDPIAIDALPDGTVLILDNTPDARYSLLFHYRLDRPLGVPVSTDAVLAVVEEEEHSGFHLRGYDFAFVDGRDKQRPTLLGRVYVTAMNGNQTYAFEVFDVAGQLALQALAEYYPMRLFSGKALVTAGDKPHYDFGESWIPLIEQKRPRYEPTATLLTPLDAPWDGREPDCVWHRLLIDGCIPPDSAVQVWSRTANEHQLLDRSEWRPEPELHQRGDGSELPFVRRTTAADAGTWELLFQHAYGRYLQLKITLTGNGRSTPRLRALRAHYPRFSYLERYLPGVYREEPESAWFLDRFLANAEGFYTAIEDKIAAVQMLFDVRSAPAEVLDWLATWFGLALDPVWDDRRRRLFIDHAMDFFQYRGTIHGLLMALHLALDECVDEAIFEPPTFESIRAVRQLGGAANRLGSAAATRTSKRRLTSIRIVEKYRLRSTPPVVLGDPTGGTDLPVVEQQARWTIEQGRADLYQRYGEFLHLSKTLPPEIALRVLHAVRQPVIAPEFQMIAAELRTVAAHEFPISAPGSDAERVKWQQFARDTLGFVPAATEDDLPRWREFLARRYATIGVLNTAYGLSTSQAYTAFARVPLPDRFPSNESALRDWYQFEGVALAMRQAAHQFSVLLPATEQLTQDEQQRQTDLALRVVQLERPAHTKFDVKFFWALFRIGEARLGEDTLVHLGSRAPQFAPKLVVGQGYLSEAYLAPGHPQAVDDRTVVGRDRVKH